MTSFDLRDKFFTYFTEHAHTQVTSSSLIPAQDPTLLFTNAGMNQFKDLFLGKEERSYKRAVSIQKCIRAGGKHNDLENVGFTKRHLTFFEMMGNFSFGDYFKKEAITYAWEFLTEVIKLEKDKLSVTVHYKDEEAYALWRDMIKVPIEKIFKLDDESNFWQMGDTGPCGPCTEIFVDRGPSFGCGLATCSPADSCDRFLEVWNLVFMQYDRLSDGTDRPLSQTGVDTGMGLERLCTIVQNKDSVFETDLFAPLIARIEELTHRKYATSSDEIKGAFRVLIDHIRSSCFAIADGGIPSNEGRGYVIRKIIRRAALFAQKLGNERLFPEVAPALIDSMGDLYPELKHQEKQIISLLENEVEKFNKTFLNGQQLLEKQFLTAQHKIISGEQSFKLYDTYGFPLELTKVMAHERGFTVDIASFEKEMEEQRLRSGKKTVDTAFEINESLITNFIGYESHRAEAKIIGLVLDKKQVSSVESGTEAYVITDISPFFIECGGQVNDQGSVIHSGTAAPLKGLKKFGNALGALIDAPKTFKIGDAVVLEVDSPTRLATMKNHTATHLLQAALIELLGKQVRQSGSVVTPTYLRFDFTYHEALTSEQISWVEDRVNSKIMENIPVTITQETLEAATKKGAIAIFGEKYQPEKVRVIDVPGFSTELCGGTHVRSTGDIGLFKITETASLSAGNRRIFAVTGPAGIELFQKTFGQIKALGTEFKVPVEEVSEAVFKQKETLKNTQTLVKSLKKQLFDAQSVEWLKSSKTIGSVPYLHLSLALEAEDLREVSTILLKKQQGVYFLVTHHKDRSPFMIALSPEYSQKIDLKNLALWLKEQGIHSGGGGTTLQGSLTGNSEQLSRQLEDWIRTHQ